MSIERIRSNIASNYNTSNNSNGLICVPSELVFSEVIGHSQSEQSVLIKSRLNSAIDVALSSSMFGTKYDINPERFKLNPYGERVISVILKVKNLDSSMSLRDGISITYSSQQQHVNQQNLPIVIIPSSQATHWNQQNHDDSEESDLSYQNNTNSNNHNDLLEDQFKTNTLISSLSHGNNNQSILKSSHGSGLAGVDRSQYSQNQASVYQRIIEDKDRQITQLESDVISLQEYQHKASYLQNQILQLQSLNTKQQATLNQSSPDISRAVDLALQQQQLQYEQKNQKVLEVFGEKDDDLKKKNNEIAQLKQNISSLSLENKQLKQQQEQQQKQLDQQQQQRKNEIGGIQQQREVLNELESMQREIATYKKELEDRQYLSNQNLELQQQLKQQQSSQQQAKRLNESLQKELDEMIIKQKYWEEYFQRKSSESKHLSERVDEYKELQEEVSKLSEQHALLLEQKEAEIQELLQELDKVRQSERAREIIMEEMTSNEKGRSAFQSNNYNSQDIQNSPNEKLNEFNQQRIAKLESQLNEMELSIQLLNQQLSSEKKQNQLLTDKLATKYQEADKVIHQIKKDKTEEEINANRLCEKYKSTLDQLQIAEKEKRTIEESNQRKQDSLRHEQKLLEDKIQKYINNEREQQSTITRLESQIDKLDKQLNHAKSGEQSGQQQYEELQNEFLELQRQIRECEQQLDIFKEKNNKLEDLNSGQQQNISELSQKNLEIKNQMNDTNASNNNKLQEQKRKIQQLEIEKENLQQNSRQLASIADELELKCKEIEDKYRQENVELQQRQIDLQSQLYSLSNEHQSSVQIIQDQEYLKDKIQISQKVNAKFEQDIKTIKIQHHEEMIEARQQIEQLELSNDRLNRQLNELQEDKVDQIKSQVEKEQLIKKLSDECEDLDHKNQLYMSENSKINELNRKYGIEIERIHAQLLTSKDQTEWAERKQAEVEEHLSAKVGQLQDQLKREQDSKLVLKRELQLEIEKLVRNQNDEEYRFKQINEELQARLVIESEERERINDLMAAKESSLVQQLKLAQADAEKSRKRRKSISQQAGEDKKRGNSRTGNRQEDSSENQTIADSTERDRLRNLEGEISRLTISILKEKQAQEQLRSALKRADAGKDSMNNEIYNLRTTVKEIIREKEDLVREMNVLQIQTKHTDPADAKVFEELQESKEIIRKILQEKERMQASLRLQEDEQQSLENEQNEPQISAKQDILRFLKKVELKYRSFESDANNEILRLKEVSNQKQTELAVLQSQFKDSKKELDKKEKECIDVMEERKDAKLSSLKNKELQEQLKRQLELLTIEKDHQIKAKDEQIQNLKLEIQKQEEAVQVLREEMVNQNKTFKEMRNQSEGQVQLLKAKFINDLNELYQKFQAFVQTNRGTGNNNNNNNNSNNSSSNAVASAAGLRDDKKYINRLFETYAENINVVCHKDAMIKKLQDKEKKYLDKEKVLSKEVDRLNEVTKKQGDEIQALLKRGPSYSQQSRRTIQLQQERLQNRSNSNINNNISNNVNSPDVSMSLDTPHDIANRSALISNNVNNKGTVKLKDIATLEAQLFTTKTSLEQAQEEVKFLKEYNNDLKEDIDRLQAQNEQYMEDIRQQNNKFNDQSKNNKLEKDKMLQEIEIIKTQYFSPDTVNEQKSIIEAKDKQIKELKDEVNRKKDLVQSVKQLKEEQSYDIKTYQVEIERLQKEVEKFKLKASKANAAAAGPSKEIKTQLENLKAIEKKLVQENEELQEKLKQQKSEINRSQFQLKELKQKAESGQASELHAVDINEQLEKSKEQCKKLKIELERKDTLYKSIKSKYESSSTELDDFKQTSKAMVSKQDLLQEQKKSEGMKNAVKKTEAQLQMLVFLLKRVFRDSFVSLNKIKSQIRQDGPSNQPFGYSQAGSQSSLSHHHFDQPLQNKFSESVNILGLSPEEIEQFIEPYHSVGNQQPNNHNKNAASEFYCDLMDRFEKELENIDQNVNVNSLYNMISSVIEERIEIISKQNNNNRR